MKEKVDRILNGEAVDIAEDTNFSLAVEKDGGTYILTFGNPENPNEDYQEMDLRDIREAGELLIALHDELKERKKLKPCPFCGGKAELVHHECKINDIRIQCTQCNIKTGWWMGESVELIERWNNRVYPPEVQAAIERDKPKEPTIKASKFGQNYFCPNCENDVSITYDRCSACGQRLDWREE